MEVLLGLPWFIYLAAAFIGAAFISIFSAGRKKRGKGKKKTSNDSAPQSIFRSVPLTPGQYEQLDNTLGEAGYAYDNAQDIFYSTMNPWQKKYGYCHLYDEAAAPLGMIIDCEPVRFEYDGKRWLIELWKGQYGITSGGEIGVYNTKGPDLDIPGLFNGTFYNCASEDENLHMFYYLKKGARVLFGRSGRHWWLTGFVLGEFSDPSELVLDASITLKDSYMRDAFITGLKRNGYTDRDFRILGNSVMLSFSKPHAKQPRSRRGLIAKIMLKRDKRLCKKFNKLTAGLDNVYDVFETLREKSPGLYRLLLNMGRSPKAYKKHDRILSGLTDLQRNRDP